MFLPILYPIIQLSVVLNGSTPTRQYSFRNGAPPPASLADHRELPDRSSRRLGWIHMYHRGQAVRYEITRTPAPVCHHARVFLAGRWEIQTAYDKARLPTEARPIPVPEIFF